MTTRVLLAGPRGRPRGGTTNVTCSRRRSPRASSSTWPACGRDRSGRTGTRGPAELAASLDVPVVATSSGRSSGPTPWWRASTRTRSTCCSTRTPASLCSSTRPRSSAPNGWPRWVRTRAPHGSSPHTTRASTPASPRWPPSFAPGSSACRTRCTASCWCRSGTDRRPRATCGTSAFSRWTPWPPCSGHPRVTSTPCAPRPGIPRPRRGPSRSAGTPGSSSRCSSREASRASAGCCTGTG